ncbi:MAG: SDR family oxidoreductase [Hyphomicrobiales bacterium]|nr:SDR family oxidoreductase [Hyphomicrobiales bacterium]
MSRFSERVVVISGGASGIGLAVAHRFAREGARLALCDLRGDELDARARDFALPAERFLCRAVDMREAAQVEAFVSAAAESFGRIDALVNNVGGGRRGRVQDLADEDWREVMALSLDSVFVASRAAMPHLAASRGTVVNIASISGLAGDGGNLAYNAAKGAVVNMTRGMAVDAGPDGVRVNAVCPGLTATPMTERMRASQTVMSQYRDRIPLGRAGEADEIANAVAFLASDEASYVTGVCLPVDGGLTAWTGQPVWRPKKI